MNAEDDELATTAFHRALRETDLEATAMRKALVSDAQAAGHESAEALYRSVVSLRDLLPAETQTDLAVCFEWAREGIARQTSGEISCELQALHAAYAYARDVMLATATKGPKR